MQLTRYIRPAVTAAAVLGFAAVAYATRDRWTPHVFPTKTEAKSADAHADPAAEEPAAEKVKLSPQAQANLGLDKDGAVDLLVPQQYWRKLVIPGVVADRPGECERVIVSRVPGIVADIKVRPGDTVKPGDELFTIQLVSEFLQGTQTDLAKTSKELESAIKKRDQTKMLVEKGTKPGIDLVDDENAVKRLTTQVEGFRRQLTVFGMNPDQVKQAEKGDVITEMVIVAPPYMAAHVHARAGSDSPPTLYEVQDLRVQLGEQLTAGKTLALLAIHQHLYVEGRAFKSEAAALADAAEKRVPVEAEFADEVPGGWASPVAPLVIHHMSNTVDPGTRTFAFYLPLDNQGRTFVRDGKTFFAWRFRPGQRVRLKLPVEKLGDDVFVLPAGAVVREGPEAFVFVQSGDVFKRKPVRVLYEDRADVVIANDGSVSPVEYVVRTPAATAINRALKAGGAEPAGHDHEH